MQDASERRGAISFAIGPFAIWAIVAHVAKIQDVVPAPIHTEASTFNLEYAVEHIRVVGMRPAWGLSSSSPFCLKLETWLRMEKIPYTAIALTKPPRSHTGKVPYILRADGSTMADSNFIIGTIAKDLNIEPAHGATAEERARTHLILRTLEESLYFVAVWERWQQPEYWPTTREAIFGYIPPILRQLLAMTIRRKMLASLQGQGIAKHDPARIAAIGQADLTALSSLLGERPYFHGDRPGLADASAYGTLANLLAFPHSTPLKRVVEQHENLVDFCRRMKNAYWSEL